MEQKYTKDEMETMFENGFNKGLNDAFKSVVELVGVIIIIAIVCIILL